MSIEQDRLEALLVSQEDDIRAAFLEFIADVNSPQVFAQIADALEGGDVDGALDIVDSYVNRFGNVLPAVQAAVGLATAEELAGLVPDLKIAISFDPSHPRAAAMARANRLLLVTNFSDEQRAATRQAITRSFETGGGTAETARAFRESIGLTSGQERWVASYEAALRALAGNALQRALRDRRFDSTVGNAINLQRPLTEAQIANMTERYRGRALMMRSENIARTEGLRAMSQARQEATQQMIEQTGVDPGRVKRIWNATNDARTRDWHASMDGQERSLDEPFTDGLGNELAYPGDPAAAAETTINCRCTLTFDIAAPDNSPG